LPDGTAANTSSPTTFNKLYFFTTAGQPICLNDSIVSVSLLIKPKYNVAITASFCPGKTYTLPDGTTANTAGTYPVTLTAANGCDSIITTTLTAGSNSVKTVSGTLCPGKTYLLPDGRTVTTGGTYTVTLPGAAASGCDSIITTILTTAVTGAKTVNDVLCPGKTYLLPDGRAVTTGGTYTVTLPGAAASGCDSIITIILTTAGTGVKTVNDKVCQGKPYLLPDGTTTTIPGTYPVTLLGAAASGCDSVVITILKEIIINTTTVNTSICKGDTLTLPDGKQVTDAGIYSVTLTSQAGCDSTVNYTVKLGLQGALLLPNSFTPNNDTRNDCFGLTQLALTNDIRFDIYSRWGQLVFSSNSPDACWDGTLKGILVPTGAYVWFLKSKTACGSRQQKGTVLLLR
jgi:gliding motility-associated-like protein